MGIEDNQRSADIYLVRLRKDAVSPPLSFRLRIASQPSEVSA